MTILFYYNMFHESCIKTYTLNTVLNDWLIDWLIGWCLTPTSAVKWQNEIND